ncbi:MAG: phosphatase PAP2 family protein [bacterium]
MDLYIFNLINQFVGRWPALDGLAIFFAKYSGYVLIFILLLFLIKNYKKYWPLATKALVSAVVSRFVITEIIRLFWPRLRPFIENHSNLIISQSPSEPSFPSGHAAFYFALAVAVYFYNKKIGIIFFAVSFLMGIARVFVGVHWPSDILAGVLVGILSAWMAVKISKRFFK